MIVSSVMKELRYMRNIDSLDSKQIKDNLGKYNSMSSLSGPWIFLFVTRTDFQKSGLRTKYFRFPKQIGLTLVFF